MSGGLIKRLIDGGNALGALQASAIWAIVCIVLAWYIYYVGKHHKRYDEKWQAIRLKEAEADVQMSIALKALAERLVDEVSEMKVIIDERLPRRHR